MGCMSSTPKQNSTRPSQPIPPTNNRVFNYSPLPYNDSIRLLLLAPAANPEAPLQASLQYVRLGSKPRYDAISYTWGTAQPSPSLHLDGATMNIVPNLESALRRFRSTDVTRTLWADQVCINQLDVKEKSVQVGQMALIYGGAEKVLIWLGEEERTTQQAFKDLISIGNGPARFGVDWSRLNMFWWNGPPTLEKSHSDESLRNYSEIARSTGVKNVYSLNWFSRLWTVQEVVLAKEAILHCGSHRMEWNTFALATEFLRAVQNEKRLLDDATSDLLERAGMIVDIRYHRDDVSHALSIILNHYQLFGIYMTMLRRQLCSDDRDRVYALLGLRPDIYHDIESQGKDLNFNMTVDYKKEPFIIYREWAVEMMGNGDVNFILDAGLWQRDLVVWVDGMIFHNQDPKWKKGCWVPEEDKGEAVTYQGGIGPARIVNANALGKWQIVPEVQHLPSWVPDLSNSSKKLTSAPWINPCMMGGDGFKARSTDRCQLQGVKWEDGFDRGGETPRRIFVKGVLLDTVGSKQAIHEWTDGAPEGVSHSEYLRNVVSTCSGLFHKTLFNGRPWLVREDMFTVFARTLLADGSGPACQSLLSRMKKASKVKDSRVAAGVRPYTDTDRLVDLIAKHVSWKQRWGKYPSIPEWPADMYRHLKTACGGTRKGSVRIDPSSPRYSVVMPSEEEIDRCLSETLEGYNFFVSSKLNYIGLGPLMAKAGDVIALIDSVHAPILLRHAQQGNKEGYMVLGPCYVHGVMRGEMAFREGEYIYLI